MAPVGDGPPTGVRMSDPIAESEQLALAVRLVHDNWPHLGERDATLDALRLRPSARLLVRRFVAAGSQPATGSDADAVRDGPAETVLGDPRHCRRVVDLTVDLANHLTNLGYATEAHGYLLAAERWVDALRDAAPAGAWDHLGWRVQSALAWAEGLGGDPSDTTLEQRRRRARDRLLPLVEAVPDGDSLRPTVLSRAARFTAGGDIAGGDLPLEERRRLHARAFELASEEDRPAAVYSSTTIRYVAFLRNIGDGSDDARRISGQAVSTLRRRAPGSRPLLLVLGQSASLARTTADSAEDWQMALELRAASVELARSVFEAAQRQLPEEADGVHRTLAAQLTNQTTLLLNVGQLDLARTACEEAIELTRSSEQDQPGSLGTRRANLADVEFAARRYGEAAAMLADAVELGRRVGSTRTASRLAGVITARLLGGTPAHQLGLLVAEMDREEPGSQGFNVHRVQSARGLLAVADGRVDAGLDLLEVAEASRARRRPVDHPDVLRVRALRAIALRRAGDLAGAQTVRESISVALRRQFPQTSHWITDLAGEELGDRT